MDWKEEPVFQQMPPAKQQMILLLTEALEGKKFTEALPVLVDWKKKMQQQNISFTKEEDQLLSQIFSSRLTSAQRKQYEYLKHFITPGSTGRNGENHGTKSSHPPKREK